MATTFGATPRLCDAIERLASMLAVNRRFPYRSGFSRVIVGEVEAASFASGLQRSIATIDGDDLTIELPAIGDAEASASSRKLVVQGRRIADLDAVATALRRWVHSLPKSSPPAATPAMGAVGAPVAAESAGPANAVKLPKLKAHDRQAWQLASIHWMTQSKVADALNKEYGTTYTQGQVSKMIARAKAHTEANGLAEKVSGPIARPRTVDPGRLELGRRVDKRKPRPSEMARANDDDE